MQWGFLFGIGADDYIYPNTIEKFKKGICQNFDLIFANIVKNRRMACPDQGKSWLVGKFQFISGHAVDTIFRKRLHDDSGLYSNRFPIAADQLFIQTVRKKGARIKVENFDAGEFNVDGISGTDVAGSLCESFRVQLNVFFNYRFCN